jgi:predicted ATPase/DNA-binding CsgD family transcriptional regulator
MFDVSRLNERQISILKRVSEGKTNQQIAAELNLAENTIKWYLKEIFQELGASNRVQAVLLARQRGYLTGSPGNVYATPGLPADTTPFVGRVREVAALREMLLQPQPRLISIVGLGGVGKTRLALEVARQVSDHFADGAVFASLASVETEEAIVPSLVQALRFTPVAGSEGGDAKSQLLDFLHDKAMLLVIDNFEQLLESASLLAELLSAGPQMKLLVTARERLRLQVEYVYPLGGLSLSSWTSVSDAERDPAIQLFLNHGRQGRPDFGLEAEDLESLQRIFRLVQGMPLAIVLAAGWVELLGPAQIADEIDRGLDFLQAHFRDLPLRQRSMRAILASGWERMDDREKHLLAALSVFRGGFTLEAAADIAGARPADLRRLLARSLLARGGEGRFEVHELLRQFAAEQLAHAEESATAVRDRHSLFYLTLLRDAESGLKGAGHVAVLSEMELDAQNHYAAWEWAVEQAQHARLGPAAFSFATFFMRLGRYEEGLVAFERAIQRLRQRVYQPEAADTDLLSGLVRLLSYQCWLQYESGDFKEAEALGKEALALLERPELEEVDTRQENGLALLRLARTYNWQDRTAVAQQMLEQSAMLFERSGDLWSLAHALRELGGVANRQAKFEQAVRYLKQAVHLLAELGDSRQRAKAQVALGVSLAGAGEQEEAEQWMRNSIEICRNIGDQGAAATTAAFLAEILSYRGKFDEARVLAAESAQVNGRLSRKLSLAASRLRWCFSLLHLGEYEAVHGHVPQILEAARANDAIMSFARARYLSGCAWLAQGEVERAREALEEAAGELRRIGSWDYLCEALPAFCCVCVRQGQFDVAKQLVLEAARIATELDAALFMAPVAGGVAFLFAALGELERAVALYALATSHPFVANSRWFKDVAGKYISDVAATLPVEHLVDAKLRGEAHELRGSGAAVTGLIEGIIL